MDLRGEVLDAQLCVSCGLCTAVCPEELLVVDVDHPVPIVTGDDPRECGDCTLCTDICPGYDTGVSESERRLFGRTRGPEEAASGVVGGGFYHVRACDPAVAGAASAGGAATGLLIAALRAGLIDAALVIGRSVDRPWIPEARLTTCEAEIIECAQATYCITPNLHLLRDVPYERIGLVGVPCQIEAIRKLERVEEPPALATKFALLIELACSSSTTLAGTEHLIQDRLGLPLESVRSMRYRAGAYPGQFTVETDEGVHTLPFHELVLEFKSFKTFRCRACPDWWSGLADVSVADGDPNIFRTSRNDEVRRKCSLAVTRTRRGIELLDLAVSAGALEADATEFDPSVNLGLQRKTHRYLRLSRTSRRRVPTPPIEPAPGTIALEDDEVIERLSR